MNEVEIANFVGLGVQTVNTLMQSYVAFRRTNVEKFFGLLLEKHKDLPEVRENDKLQRIVFKIVEHVSTEVTEEKINNWKNLTVKLATEFDSFDVAETYVKILEDLTAVDLTILFAIYSKEFKTKYFLEELIAELQKKNLEEDIIMYSIKALARHNLIIEQSDGATYLYDGDKDTGQKFRYEKNNLGRTFLKLIS